MPTLYDLPTLLDQNTEGINFSAHLRFMAMAFQVAVNTLVLRSRLREVRTMPSVGASFLPLLFINIQSYSARQPSISAHIERTHPCRDESIAATLLESFAKITVLKG
jgi:hypothetical protein